MTVTQLQNVEQSVRECLEEDSEKADQLLEQHDKASDPLERAKLSTRVQQLNGDQAYGIHLLRVTKEVRTLRAEVDSLRAPWWRRAWEWWRG